MYNLGALSASAKQLTCLRGVFRGKPMRQERHSRAGCVQFVITFNLLLLFVTHLSNKECHL